MAKIRARDPNVKIDFILERISQKDDVDFYVSSESEYQFFPYRIEIGFYSTEFATKTDYVSIMVKDLEIILGKMKEIIDGEIGEFDIESTEGDFFVSMEKADEEGGLFWVSIDMSGMLFGQDFDKTEGTAISFTFLATKDHVENFYQELLSESKEVIEDLREKYPEEFEKLSDFYERLSSEKFKLEMVN